MMKTMLSTVAFIAMCGAFLVWRHSVPPPVPLVAAVFSELSQSVVRNCKVEQALARYAIERMNRAPGSRLDFYSNGSAATAYAPVPWRLEPIDFTPPKILQAGSGGSDSKTPPETARYLAAVKTRCEAWSGSDSSAIFMGLKHVVAQVQVERPEGAAALVIGHTDLQELVVKAIATALNEPQGAPLRNMPAPIDNTDVDVLLCGFAETQGKVNGKTYTRLRHPDSLERAREVWSSVFTEPSSVTFREFCPAER